MEWNGEIKSVKVYTNAPYSMVLDIIIKKLGITQPKDRLCLYYNEKVRLSLDAVIPFEGCKDRLKIVYIENSTGLFLYNWLIIVEPVKNQYLYIKFNESYTKFLYNENYTIGSYFEQMIKVCFLFVNITFFRSIHLILRNLNTVLQMKGRKNFGLYLHYVIYQFNPIVLFYVLLKYNN